MTPVSRTRKKGRNRSRKRKQKRGDAYQEAVAQVAKGLSPAAYVDIGSWIDGPDGRRDLDVVLRTDPNVPPFAVIECKDWNRPIGIGFIDALESKRRDIGATAALICSNSGFTADALRKAARVGIPALAALIKGDNRIKVVVRQQIYTRIVNFLHHNPRLQHRELSDELKSRLTSLHTNEMAYDGKSMEAWVALQLLTIAGMATRDRSFVARYNLRGPISVVARGVELLVTSIEINAAFTVQWMTQVAEFGASQGMFDYLRQVVVVGPGLHQVHLTVNTETWGTPVDIDEVPPRLLGPQISIVVYRRDAVRCRSECSGTCPRATRRTPQTCGR